MGDRLLSDEGGWEGLLSGGKFVMQMRRMRNISSKMLGNCRNSKTVYICYYERKSTKYFRLAMRLHLTLPQLGREKALYTLKIRLRSF